MEVAEPDDSVRKRFQSVTETALRTTGVIRLSALVEYAANPTVNFRRADSVTVWCTIQAAEAANCVLQEDLRRFFGLVRPWWR